MTALVPVILSGGAGTRLWPQSRRLLPKPFMRLPDGRSLFGHTLDRACALEGSEAPLIVTHRDYYFLVRDELSRAAIGGRTRFILEPAARNTAPAIALAVLAVAQQYGSDAILLSLPADHVIEDQAAFQRSVMLAIEAASQGHLVTFGARIERPATGYGYIKAGAPLAPGISRVERFIEKPPADEARRYMATGRFYWNSGMFAFRAADMLDALEDCRPALLRQARACWQRARQSDVLADAVELAAVDFESLESISIDYAVFEKASSVAVVPGDFGWSDVGAWNDLAARFDADARGNRGVGNAMFVDSDRCFVHGDQRLVVTLGLRDVYVIDTPDSVLVLDESRAQDVRQVVEAVRARGGSEHETHVTVARPWGSYTVLNEAPGFKIKRVEVKPGEALSLQMHRHRSEHWVVVEGSARVTNGDQQYVVAINESTFIPAGVRHRLENCGDGMLVLIEVQSGSYVGEDDIVRFADRYGRHHEPPT